MIRGSYWGGTWGLSWGGTWGEAWLLLNQPYQELSIKGQVFVRSYLTHIHSVEVAEQIISVAALNNISVIDAEVVVTAQVSEARLDAVKKRPKSRIEQPKQAKQPERKKHLDLTVLYSQKAVFAEQHRASISAEATQASLVAYHNAMRADLINYAD